MRSLGLLVAVSSAYALLRGFPADWHGGARSALAVVVLALGVFGWLPRVRRGKSVISSVEPVRMRNLLWLVGGLLAIECVLWGFFGAMPSRLESVAADFQAWLRPGAAVASEEEAGSGEARGGHWLINNTRMRPLPERTNLKPGNRPEVFVQPLADAASLVDRQLYVHAFGLGEFREGAWRIGSEESWEIPADSDGWVRFGEDSAQDPMVCRMYHSYQRNGENLVLGMQGLESVEMERVTEVDRGMHLLPPPREGEDGYRYDARSRPTMLDDLVGLDVSVPEEVPARLLEMPDGALGFRLADLTRVVQGDGEPVERLMKIRNHLRTTLDYSLVTENPEGRDPLENFLFYEQRGHCEFFATAGALLARAAGVPSRICYGWSGGTYYETSGYFVFRTNEAHAWTEVLLDGWGWVVLDPTPADGLIAGAPRVAGEDELPPGLDDEFDFEDGALEVAGLWVPLSLLLVGLPVLCLLGLRALKKRSGAEHGSWSYRSRPAGYLQLFLTGCRERGVRVLPGATLRSVGEALEVEPPFLGDLLTYHYSTTYEGKSRDEAREAALEGRIRSWS